MPAKTIALTLSAAAFLLAQAPASYRITHTYTLRVDGAGYDAASGNVLETVQTPPGSRIMGLDPVNHRVYIVSGKFGPPPATGRGRGPVLPGSFSLLVIER